MKPILLATTSRYKRALFEKLGIPFSVAAPDFEEYLVPGLDPIDLAGRLAEGKARSLVQAWPEHLIIGADQILAIGDRVLTKPGSVEAAVAQLQTLAGNTHYLHTAFTVLDSITGVSRGDVVTAEITFHAGLDPEFLRALVIRDQTTDCVGGYKFEEGGILLMNRVQTPDPNAIVGLPLLALARVLRQFGWLRERFVS